MFVATGQNSVWGSGDLLSPSKWSPVPLYNHTGALASCAQIAHSSYAYICWSAEGDDLGTSAMSAPPIAIFAHDKKADSHGDPRAWLKTRVSSPPQKAHPPLGHSPVHRKGPEKVQAQAAAWTSLVTRHPLWTCRCNTDHGKAKRVPELSTGCSFPPAAVRVQRSPGCVSPQ